MSTSIGWIGTGVMGAAMAGHLMDAGHRLKVHTRTKAKAQALLDRGAQWAETPAHAADGADVAISIVGFPTDVEAVHLGASGTLTATTPPKIVVDMTTSGPSLARTIHERAGALHIAAIDAPVSGGDVGAIDGTLSVMVGGDVDAVERVRPLFECFGKQIVRQGGAGAGQHTKMVNQILIASGMVGVAEGMLYAQRAGLDARSVLDSVGSGAAGSWSVSNLAPRMIDRNFDPGFFIEHFIKDLGIALDEAAAMGLDLPGLAQAHRLYETAREQGHGRRGTHALLLVLEQLNGQHDG